MTSDSHLAEADIGAYLEQHQKKELLRFVSVGSVDDGKSTLIGRLLHDTHGIYEDQLAAVKRASTQNDMEIDFSLFTDGLEAEREQGITIDVAYRYFSTARRKFIIADTPGHVQYTRNMATGASTANVALILIDARLGVLQQSRRHAYIAALLGIPHLAVCVNKMDLREYSQKVFDDIVSEFRGFAKNLGFQDIKFLPISALKGDNVVHRSETMPWFEGGTVLEYLETVPIANDQNLTDFRYPVQYVVRPNLDYRGFAGQITSGMVRPGDPILVLPSRKTSRVKSIDTFNGPLELAHAPMSVTLRLEDEVDVSRGDILVRPDNLPNVGRRFDANVVWMSETPLDPAKSYLLKHTTQMVRVDVETVTSVTDMETLAESSADTLQLNDIGQLRLSCHRPLYFDPYQKNRGAGAFVMIDSITNNTVGAGMIIGPALSGRDGSRERTLGLTQPESEVSAAEREALLGQKGTAILLCGLPAAGKSEIAYELERRLVDMGRAAVVIDPDDATAREGDAALGDGTTLTETTLQIAQRAVNAGLMVILPLAIPKAADRAMLRDRLGKDQLLEVFVSASVETRRTRDRLDRYDSKRDFNYESAESADLEVLVSAGGVEACAKRVAERLAQLGRFADGRR